MSDSLHLSGERFQVVYELRGSSDEAAAAARAIGIEQTVEFPEELVERGSIREQIFGQLTDFHAIDDDVHEATISYSVDLTGGELPQLLNVIFGNTSLKPGVRVKRLELPAALLRMFRGPRFGRDGWRERLAVGKRPLLCTALKPMGLSPHELARLAYQFARGGIDIVKDDHGLANQPFCPFEERVKRCVEAVGKATSETGERVLYAPNVTSPADQLAARAHFAKREGAGALLISPGLMSFDSVRYLAADDALSLPLIVHPALQGSFLVHRSNGISHGVLLAQIPRLAGADAVIFPHAGGRFSFTPDDCREIARAAAEPIEGIAPILPVPAGGMPLARVPELWEFYGNDVILLIGGALHRGKDIIATCREFRRCVEAG
ncbi:MAG: RuBisCO large subunit C-terminal-like domain-containing protein [Planctomycetota bacterium]